MKIARVRNITIETFVNEFLIPKKPVIVTDATLGWNREKFTPADLSREFGNHNVQVYNDLFDLQNIETLSSYLNNNFGQQENSRNDHEYIRWYTKFKEIDFFWSDEVFESLKGYWAHPYFLPNNSYALPLCAAANSIHVHESSFLYKGLFISGKGARTRLHRDPLNSNAVLCQFYGEKKIHLYSPDQAGYLMAGNDFVDINNADLKKFKLYSKATCTYEDILSPGEIVFFPAGWFHDVTSLNDSISITWNFIHSVDLDGFISYLAEHSDDEHLDTVRYFLKNRIGENAGIQEITLFLKNQFLHTIGSHE